MEGIKRIFIENTGVIILYVGSIVLILLFNQIHIVLHEFGHLIFGLMTGFRFLSFRIRKHVLIKTEQGYKHKITVIKESAGQCLMAPSEKRHWFLYNAGGIIINLVTGGIAGVLICCMRSTIIQYVLFWFGFVGIFLGIQNAIPRTKKIINDGATIRELCGSAAARNAYFMQLEIIKDLCNGVQYRDMDIEKLKLEEENYTSDLCAYIDLVRYYHFLDGGDYKKAEKELRHLELRQEHLSTCSRQAIKAERYYLELLKGNPDASDYYIPIMDYLKDDFDINVLRIRYLRYQKDEQYSRAAACYAWALAVAKECSLAGEGAFNLEQIVQLYHKERTRWTTSDGS